MRVEHYRAVAAARNPLAWIIDVNGLAVDARHVPPGIQAGAYRRGLIPYIPAQQTFGASQRAGVLQVAAELAAKHPRLVFRNPKHKRWCFGARSLPPVTPLSSELAEALPSSR